mgnify:CR=1 FL=1
MGIQIFLQCLHEDIRQGDGVRITVRIKSAVRTDHPYFLSSRDDCQSRHTSDKIYCVSFFCQKKNVHSGNCRVMLKVRYSKVWYIIRSKPESDSHRTNRHLATTMFLFLLDNMKYSLYYIGYIMQLK